MAAQVNSSEAIASLLSTNEFDIANVAQVRATARCEDRGASSSADGPFSCFYSIRPPSSLLTHTCVLACCARFCGRCVRCTRCAALVRRLLARELRERAGVFEYLRFRGQQVPPEAVSLPARCAMLPRPRAINTLKRARHNRACSVRVRSYDLYPEKRDDLSLIHI